MAKGKTLEDFAAERNKKDRARAQRIAKVVQALGDGWEYELEISKRAHVGLRDMAELRKRFESQIVQVQDTEHGSRIRHLWCGTIAFAKKLRAQADATP